METIVEKLSNVSRALATSEEMAFDAGYKAAIDGPDTTNCHFSWFRSPEMTAAWERGNKAGKKKP